MELLLSPHRAPILPYDLRTQRTQISFVFDAIQVARLLTNNNWRNA